MLDHSLMSLIIQFFKLYMLQLCHQSMRKEPHLYRKKVCPFFFQFALTFYSNTFLQFLWRVRLYICTGYGIFWDFFGCLWQFTWACKYTCLLREVGTTNSYVKWAWLPTRWMPIPWQPYFRLVLGWSPPPKKKGFNLLFIFVKFLPSFNSRFCPCLYGKKGE